MHKRYIFGTYIFRELQEVRDQIIRHVLMYDNIL